MKKYYTLAVREAGCWTPQFGDYERSVVADESRDGYGDVAKKDKRIVASGDSQAAINAAVAALN